MRILKPLILSFISVLFISIMVSCSTNTDNSPNTSLHYGLPVLSGVTGFGLDATGGKDGIIIPVTNLNCEGKGSFAEAINTEGKRIIVFEVAGIIDLEGKSLVIKNPFITIAGQTAPSPGITLIRGGLVISTHEIIIQHIRVRPGEAGHDKKSGWEVDGITTNKGAYNVIIDHCSTTWATDENLSVSGPRHDGQDLDQWRSNTSHKITISNCIIASGLSHSTHIKGEHSKGTLVHDNATEILIYGNLYANNVDRHPLCKGGTQTVITNNFISNPGRAIINYSLVKSEWEGYEWVTGKMTVIGNYIEHGPNTSEKIFTGNFNGPVEVYWEDNKVVSKNDIREFNGNPVFLETRPLWPNGLTPLPSDEVKKNILKNAGAFPWNRDEIDNKIIADVISGNGKIINSEAEAGGYPVVKPVYRKFNINEWDMETLTKKNRL